MAVLGTGDAGSIPAIPTVYSVDMDRDPLTELAHCAEHVCLAESPDGLVCTDEPNHRGWHHARGEDGELLDEWPQLELGEMIDWGRP